MRCFLAVVPPEEVRGALESIPRSQLPRVRWVHPTEFHVTLRFFPDLDLDGSLGRETLAAVADVLSSEAVPPGVVIGASAELLGRDVLVLPVQGLDSLARLLRPPGEAFRGHLTLARGPRLGTLLPLGLPAPVAFTPSHLHLVASTLSAPPGRRHATVLSWNLPGGSASEHLFAITVLSEPDGSPVPRVAVTPPP